MGGYVTVSGFGLLAKRKIAWVGFGHDEAAIVILPLIDIRDTNGDGRVGPIEWVVPNAKNTFLQQVAWGLRDVGKGANFLQGSSAYTVLSGMDMVIRAMSELYVRRKLTDAAGDLVQDAIVNGMKLQFYTARGREAEARALVAQAFGAAR